MVIVNAKIAKCMHAIALAICKLCYSCIYDPAWYCIALVSSAAMHPMHAPCSLLAVGSPLIHAVIICI